MGSTVHKLVGPTYASLRNVARPLTYSEIFSSETKKLISDMSVEMQSEMGIGIAGNYNFCNIKNGS